MNYTKQKKNLFEEEESSTVKNVATKFMQGIVTSNLPGMAGKAVASQIGSASKELYSPKASSSTKAASSADKASSGMSTPLSPTKTNSSVGSASQSSASGSLGSLYKNSGTASKSGQTASERLKEAFSSTKPNAYTPQSSEKYKSSSEIVKKTKNKFDSDPTLNEIKTSYDKAKKASGYEQKSRIQSLQNSLNKYGVRDSEENTLKEDGIYGEKTRSAFESLYEKPTAAKNAKYDMKLKELRRQGEKVSTQHKPYKASHQQGLDFVYDVVNLQKNLNKAGIYDDEANTLEVDGIFGDRTKSALTKLSTTKAEDLYPANRITNHNRELISRALDISSRITDTLYPSIPLGLVQRQLNEAGFRDVNGELLVEDGIFGEQMEGALRGYIDLSEYLGENSNDELNAEKNSYISRSNRISPDTAIIKALPNPPPRGDSFDPVTDTADYMQRLPEREKNVFTAVLKHGENNDDEDLIKVAKILNGENIGAWDGAKITIHVEQLKVKEEKYSKAKGVTGIASIFVPTIGFVSALEPFIDESDPVDYLESFSSFTESGIQEINLISLTIRLLKH